MVIGIPVYYHYCGGELEEINYVLKSNTCCGGEEDDSDDAGNDCCKDENLVLKSDLDFTIKELNTYTLVNSVQELLFFSLPFTNSIEEVSPTLLSLFTEFPPPRLQHQNIISTSVLRI
jgi:hypothetical protein